MFVSVEAGDGDGTTATGKMAAKRETTVWGTSTFASVKPLDSFNQISGQFPAMFVATGPQLWSFYYRNQVSGLNPTRP